MRKLSLNFTAVDIDGNFRVAPPFIFPQNTVIVVLEDVEFRWFETSKEIRMVKDGPIDGHTVLDLFYQDCKVINNIECKIIRIFHS